MRSSCAILLVLGFALTLTAGDDVAVKGDEKKLVYLHGASYGGGRKGVDHYCHHGSTIVFSRKPMRLLACFGVSKEPGAKARYLYFLLFKTTEDLDRPALGLMAAVGPGTIFRPIHAANSKRLRGQFIVVLTKNKLDVAYDFHLDPKTKAVVKQSLKLGGKEGLQNKARVFVVDLTQKKVRYHPVKVELPTDVPDMAHEKDTMRDAAIRRAVEQLMKSPEVKKTLE